MSRNKIGAPFILFLALIMGGCEQWQEHYSGQASNTNNLLQILETTADANEFVSALKKTGLDKMVANDEVYTVFIPPTGKLSGLTDEQLKDVLGNHIVFKRYYFGNLQDSLQLQTASGRYYTIKKTATGYAIDTREKLVEITGTLQDIEAQNGVVQSIADVLSTVPNIEAQLSSLDAEKYSIFLNNYNKYDSIVPGKVMYNLTFNEEGGVILSQDPFWTYPSFNASEESLPYTLLVPSDQAILEQRAQLLELNGGREEAISPYYYTRLIRNQMLRGAYGPSQLFDADTIITEGENWVVGKKLDPLKYGTSRTASNGYMFESDDLVYSPIAADFIDSIVYEAEWALGFEGHEKTLIYTCETEPTVGGNGETLNHHLFASSLNRNNSIQFFIPGVFKGLYQVKVQYMWSAVTLRMFSENIPIYPVPVNLETYISKDINNPDPNNWAYGSMGEVFLPEEGNLNINFVVTGGSYATLMIDKIVLVPLEY